MSDRTEIIVSDNTFSTRILKSPRPVLVMFTSRGCIACEFLSWRLPKSVANAGIGFARC